MTLEPHVSIQGPAKFPDQVSLVLQQACTMSRNSDNTIGAAFIGMVVAAVLYGISCVQALYYYTNQNDPWYIKITVTAVMIFDTVHQALISHTVYTYTITDWGDPVHAGYIIWSLVAEVMFTGVTAFIVQSFLTMRIWRLSNRNIYLTGSLMILVTAGFVTVIVSVVKLSEVKFLVEVANLKGLSISFNALQAVADLLIAITLCTILNTSRTGFHKSEIIINRLIVFTVNTGLLTSLCAVGSLVFIPVAGNTFINIAFFFCLGRLYTNTLLATLNARNIIRDVNHGAGSTGASFSLQQLSKSGSTQHQNISININTTSQKCHDRKLDEENPVLSYGDEERTKVAY